MNDINSTQIQKIVQGAGGEIVGRTRLQKIAYLLQVTGQGISFEFSYKHYGPYSEDLASTVKMEILFDKLSEEEKKASWGGTYSVYRTEEESQGHDTSSAFAKTTTLAAKTDSIVLELAATAVFLSNEGYDAPWKETVNRKPSKSSEDKIALAKKFLKNLSCIELPDPLPTNAL